MKKRIVSLLLVLALCAALLPTIALAADPYNITVCGGTPVNSSSASDIKADGITAGTVSFDPSGENDGWTLTLENATMAFGSGAAVITENVASSPSEALTIVLKGENNITVKSGASYGISWANNLTITGVGSLNIQFAEDGNPGGATYCGIFTSGNLRIENGAEVTVSSSSEGKNPNVQLSYGIFAFGNLCIDGTDTKVTAYGKSVDKTGEVSIPFVYSYGVACGKNLSVTNGASLTAVGGSVSCSEDKKTSSYGVSASGTVAVTGGASLTATGGKAENANYTTRTQSFGLYSSNDVTVGTGSTLTATGGETNNKDSGYRTSAGIKMDLSTLNVEAGGHLTAETKMLTTNCMAIEANKLTLGEPYYWRMISKNENNGELTNFVSSKTKKYDAYDASERQFHTYVEISPTGSTESGGDDDDDVIDPEFSQNSYILFGGLLAGLVDGSANVLDTTFADVSHGAYYYNAVEWAYNKGIAGGMDAKHFAPDESCTRAQAVTMLYRAAGCPDIWGENPFVDVDASDYYYKAVLWAVANGITSGTDATHFSPDEPCTRGQIVTFLHRAARCYQAHESFGFTDVKTGSYCEDAVNWAVETGITNGTGVDTFSPDAPCTRAQIVTFLYRNR